MINSPKDLDQADVNRDAQTMYGEEMDELGNLLDPVDLFTVLSMIHDDQDGGQDFDEFLRTSQLAGDLIKFSQSNPSRSHTALVRMHELDQAISEL